MTRKRSYINILAIGILIGGLIMYLWGGRGKGNETVEVSHTMIVQKIEDLGNLEVVQYNIQDLMEYKKVRQWLPNAKTALIVSGEVIGCIDLTKVKPEDIYTSGDSIRLRLPAPEICHIKINHSESRIYDMQFGLWESTQIADEAYRYAENELRRQAMKLDITSKSRDNAANLLRPILQAMGFEYVYITFDNENSYREKPR